MNPKYLLKKKKFWRWSSKWLPIINSIVGGIIIASITAYIIFITGVPRAKLIAVADYQNWSAPSTVTSDLTALDGARSQFKGQDPNDHSHFEKKHNDLNTVWVMLDGEPNYPVHDIGKMICMCFITISNKAEAEAKEVKMYFPDANYVEIYREGIAKKQVKRINDQIYYRLVDSLPGGGEIKVQVWTNCESERECADKLNIACLMDRASIDVRTPVRGVTQLMSDHPEWTIVLIAIIWFVIHAFVVIKRRKNKPKPKPLVAQL